MTPTNPWGILNDDNDEVDVDILDEIKIIIYLKQKSTKRTQTKFQIKKF